MRRQCNTSISNTSDPDWAGDLAHLVATMAQLLTCLSVLPQNELFGTALRRKLFEEGLPATLAAALTATAKAPVHALTNGVHAAVASVTSAAALPFVSSGAAAPVSPLSF